MATIWRLATVHELLPVFEAAGPIDQAVVEAHLAQLRPDQRPVPPREPALPRWFFSLPARSTRAAADHRPVAGALGRPGEGPPWELLPPGRIRQNPAVRWKGDQGTPHHPGAHRAVERPATAFFHQRQGAAGGHRLARPRGTSSAPPRQACNATSQAPHGAAQANVMGRKIEQGSISRTRGVGGNVPSKGTSASAVRLHTGTSHIMVNNVRK